MPTCLFEDTPDEENLFSAPKLYVTPVDLLSQDLLNPRPQNPKYSAPPQNKLEGLMRKFSNCKRPTDDFKTLIDEILQPIVYQIYLYATQKGERVVLQLTKQFWGQQRIEYIDNYFSSLPLLEMLQAKGVLSCGTIRGYSNINSEKKLKRDHKAIKWWHRLFFGLLDIAFVNYLVIYKVVIEPVSVLEFRHSVVQGLASQKTVATSRKRSLTDKYSPQGGSQKGRKSGYSVTKDVRLVSRGIHWPRFTEKRGRCEVCSVIKWNFDLIHSALIVKFTCVAMTRKIVMLCIMMFCNNG
ncbi:hypothetical protein PR048_008234 [Dryococelus australis]|uniref:PiggyBac transposable element-derived protein domain-containing protein n=1 Tax=Dryococelus australis TaxID=614101 RepID=A0ABQ9HWV6_9NEOP|nr:hypothetical protein PR048_008234 [Dryococelus australis]